MRDANYLRAQAELCLEMARQMSDPKAAATLKAAAAKYHAEAASVEEPQPGLAASGEYASGEPG
jgi:hypothetical protein